MKFVLGKVKSIVGKVENAGNQYFSSSHNVFKSFHQHGCENLGLFGIRLHSNREQGFGLFQTESISIGECNTILSAHTMYRHLEKYCTHLQICRPQNQWKFL